MINVLLLVVYFNTPKESYEFNITQQEIADQKLKEENYLKQFDYLVK